MKDMRYDSISPAGGPRSGRIKIKKENQENRKQWEKGMDRMIAYRKARIILNQWENGGDFMHTQLSAAKKADTYHLKKLYSAFPTLVWAILIDRGIKFKVCNKKLFIK